MNKQPTDTNSQDFTQAIDHIQPIADATFQDMLETQLMSEWYLQHGHPKKKHLQRLSIPYTFIASLIIIATMSLVVMLFQSQIAPLAGQYLPDPTPVPTPDTLTPSPISLTSDFQLTLEADTVTLIAPIEIEHLISNGFKVGDKVDIVATIQRHELDSLIPPIRLELTELLDEYETDELSINLIESVTIIDMKNLAEPQIILQLTQQQSVLLTWLLDSQIPYKIIYTS